MTLEELSVQYREAAQPIRARLRLLRQERKHVTDREALFRIDRRMRILSTLLHQTNEMAELTAHYYERGYYRNEKYRI